MLNLLKIKGIFLKNLIFKQNIPSKLFFKSAIYMNFSTQQQQTIKDANQQGKNKIDEELKPAPFIPYEKMTPKKLFKLKKENLSETFYYYGNQKHKESEKLFNVMEFYSKKLRRDYILSGEIESHKHIIPVKRIRNKEDTIAKLQKNKEIAAVIQGREEFKDIDIVLDKSLVDKLRKKNFYKVRPYYLRFGKDLIRCTLINPQFEHISSHYLKMHFQRYIVGRPNLLNLQLKLVGRHLQTVIEDLDLEVDQIYTNVDVWCCTEEYPPILEIDCRLFTSGKPFLFRDLLKVLPEGMWLHRKYDSYMNQAIVTLGENYNLLLASNNFPIVNPDNPEENDFEMDMNDLYGNSVSKDNNLRRKILQDLHNLNFDDDETFEELVELAENGELEFLNELKKEPELKIFAEQEIIELQKEEEDLNEIEKQLDKEISLLKKEGEQVEEITEVTGVQESKFEDKEDENASIDSKEAVFDDEGNEIISQDGFDINEDRINEILSDLKKRKVVPKGSTVPLMVASSKKLTQNKFETNSVAKFKKAQQKGASGGKKDKKK